MTRIGSDNLFMAYAHVAHDCQVGSHTIFANAATLAGHVEVADYATIGAFSGVHQFCRVGAHAFMGGYTVATKDVLPYSKTVGNRARIYGVNTVGPHAARLRAPRRWRPSGAPTACCCRAGSTPARPWPAWSAEPRMTPEVREPGRVHPHREARA